jgi:hypothetical protein
MRALRGRGFGGPMRPDHGRMIWGAAGSARLRDSTIVRPVRLYSAGIMGRYGVEIGNPKPNDHGSRVIGQFACLFVGGDNAIQILIAGCLVAACGPRVRHRLSRTTTKPMCFAAITLRARYPGCSRREETFRTRTTLDARRETRRSRWFRSPSRKKRRTPLSGDKHDYMSLGFWWRIRTKPNGVPFIRWRRRCESGESHR